MTCEETFRRLDDFLDHELSESECLLVQEHLEICAICAAEFKFEASIWSEVRAKLQRMAVPPGLREKVAHLLRDINCFDSTEEQLLSFP
jgi:anti-sigma factor (TIGR02949 family)